MSRAWIPLSIRRLFSVKDGGRGHVLLRCDQCTAVWRLRKKASGPWVLRLMDHAAGHEQGHADPEAERERILLELSS